MPWEIRFVRSTLTTNRLSPVLGFYPGSGHGLHLRHEWIKTASHLGLEIDCDFYFEAKEDAGG